ncbi:Quinidine resistance protein 1 [Fusarium culmorum]|uniref:Quinidine resistance protein 1 n=1 Tax=Fusarium culmorum TaxID=5516 RepID=A0A2T4GH06_FUSCU|nr:Quinidine resistance protein 1 [Fusarium culmorum]
MEQRVLAVSAATLVASKQPTPTATMLTNQSCQLLDEDRAPALAFVLFCPSSLTPRVTDRHKSCVVIRASKQKMFSHKSEDQPAAVNGDAENTMTVPHSSYTTFGRKQSLVILCLASFAATFSPLSSFIFFRPINDISEGLHVSVSRVNLTITSYMIVASLAPAVLGDLADKVDRRIIYIFMMTIYCAANIGLALQSNWTALFVLRMVQSAGIAATIALGYGVVSDIAPPSERGSFVSIMVLGPNIATAVGPIIGAALTSYLTWRWIFLFLAIRSGTCLLMLAFFILETARSIVGDGSVRVSGLRRTILLYLQSLSKSLSHDKREEHRNDPIVPNEESTGANSRSINPLDSLKLLWAKDTLLITLIFGIFYMNLSALQASTSTLFISVYGVSGLRLGLIYLPSGIGSCLGAYGAGSILDRDYRMTARKHGININFRAGENIDNFPIEEARFRSIWCLISIGTISLISYGWTMHFQVVSAKYRTLSRHLLICIQNMVVPLVLHFLIGCSTAIIFNPSNASYTALTNKRWYIDVWHSAGRHPPKVTIITFLAGSSTGLIQVFIDAMGIGWIFTLFGEVGFSSVLAAWLEWRYGQCWREMIRANGINR